MYLRLAFSIMVHLDFDVYLLDEVLGVGDEEFYERILKKMQALVSSNKSVLFTSHNLNEIIRFTSKSLYFNNRILRFDETFIAVSEYLASVNKRKDKEVNRGYLLRKFDIDDSKEVAILEASVVSDGAIVSNPIHPSSQLRFVIKYYLKSFDINFDFVLKFKCGNAITLFETASFNSSIFFKPDNTNHYNTIYLEFPSNYFNNANITVDLLITSDIKIIEEVSNLFFISFRNGNDLLFNMNGALQYKGMWGSLIFLK
jgi:hypothetical protein